MWDTNTVNTDAVGLVYSTVMIKTRPAVYQYAQVCVFGTEIVFLSVLLVFSAPMKERLADTNTDKVLCPTRVQPHVLSSCWLEKWFFLLGWDNSGIAVGKCLFCIRREGFVFANGAPPGEEMAVNDGEMFQMYQQEGTETGWRSELGLTAAFFHFAFPSL